MKKFNEYTVEAVTAIAISAGDTSEADRQDALLVRSEVNGEIFESVVFGYDMPESDEDFLTMCEDCSAWDSDCETLDTVKITVDSL